MAPGPAGRRFTLLPMYQPRTYRVQSGSPDLVSFRACVAETDLFISAESDLSLQALRLIRDARAAIEQEIARDRRFLTSLEPLPVRAEAPPIVRAMYESASAAGVGPMAAVAGAVAEYVAAGLLAHSPQVVVENGGDIYLVTKHSRVVGIQAGNSSLSGRVGLAIPPETSLSICTSSGTVGHSLSFGKADAAVAVANTGALADAVATALGNRVQTAADVQAALDWAQTVPGIREAIVIVGETLGVWGEFELQPTV